MKTDTYSPDDFTKRHLHSWFERGACPCDESRAEYCEVRMLEWLQEQSTEDAEYAMGQGWHHVFYRATETKIGFAP